MAHLRTWFLVLRRPYYALDSFSEDKIRELVAGEKRTNEGTAIGRENEDFFYSSRG